MKTKIVRSIVLNKAVAHRSTFTHCPHCDHKLDTEEWEKLAHTLMLDEAWGKHGSVVVVAECPHCFKSSWVHQPFSFFTEWHDTYPEEWKVAATSEHDRRHLIAVHQFADSLCSHCVHLRSLEIDTLPILECTMGGKPAAPPSKTYLHSHFGYTKCAKYQERKVVRIPQDNP